MVYWSGSALVIFGGSAEEICTIEGEMEILVAQIQDKFQWKLTVPAVYTNNGDKVLIKQHNTGPSHTWPRYLFLWCSLSHTPTRAHTHKVTSFHWRHLTTVIPAECLSQTVSAKQREERPQHDLLWLNCSGDYLVFKIRVTHTQHTHNFSQIST